jgi:hypothetical protein
VLSPAPPPLRTGRAPFDASGSSIEQRLCVARPGRFHRPTIPLTRRGLPIGPGVNLDVTAPVPVTEDRRRPHLRALPPETFLLCPPNRLAVGSRPTTPGGSGLAFARGDVSTPIRPVTGQPSLPPPSSTCRPIGSPCGSPTLAGGRRAYHVASRESSWVRPRLDAGGTTSAPGELGAPGPGHVPFGPGLSASLACPWLRRLRRFTWVGRTTRPWSPTASMLAVAASARASTAILADEDTLFRGLRTPPLPETHASVGDCWQNSRCRHLLRKSNTLPAIPSCRTLTTKISGPRQRVRCIASLDDRCRPRRRESHSWDPPTAVHCIAGSSWTSTGASSNRVSWQK